MLAYLYTFKKELREVPGPGYVERARCMPRDHTTRGPFDSSPIASIYKFKDIEYKHFVDNGQHFCVGMDPEVKEALAFLWYEERDAMLQRLKEAEDVYQTVQRKFQTLRNDIRVLEAMPWYRRVWAAYRKILP